MSTTIGNSFSFLPWVKNTLTRKATPGAGLRPVVPVTLSLAVGGGGNPTQDVERDVAVHGPGDVIGLQPEAVLKTTPPAGEQQYPASLLASIEFGEEDLPWRYSPEQLSAAGGNSQWAPWCFLVVLKASEFTVRPQGNAPLQSIDIVNPATVFPETTTRWAWAHVQTNTELGSQTAGMSASDVAGFLGNDLKADPDLAFSRILSPRHLEEDTDYHAFLVPSYESGRIAGLGLEFPANLTATLCAWEAAPLGYTRPADSAHAFPVYYQWSFRTSTAVDFEALASLLKPEVLVDFGTQPLSLTTPLSSAGSATPPNRQYVLNLPGIIQELGAPVMRVPASIATDFYTTLNPPATQPRLRPLVTPPIYGRTYVDSSALHDPRQTTTVNWLDQVNTHPGYRSMAAIGSQVVQDNQEEYMKHAWEQVRDIIVANANLRGMQSGLETTDSLRHQHLPLTGSGADSRTAFPSMVDGRSVPSATASSGNSTALTADETSFAARTVETDDKAEQGQSVESSSGADPTPPTTSSFITTAGSGGTSMENYGLHLTGLAFSRILDPSTGVTLQETVRQSNVPLAAFTPAFRRILKPFGRYQTNLGGQPRRPTVAPDTFPNDTLLKQEGHSLNLHQRDALLTLLAEGTITGAPRKPNNLLGYQFDDDTIRTILNAGTKEIALWIYTPGGDGVHQAVTHGEVYEKFLTAFESFSAVDFTPPPVPEQPTLDLESLKQAVIEGTKPGPVFLARANRAIRFLPHYGSYAPRGSTTGLPMSGIAARSSFAAAPSIVAPAPPPEAPLLTAVQPVMAYPAFKDPMGPVLQQRHPEMFLPNAGEFPPNAITLLEYNHAFIEAYLLGLNHAFGSELLWRNYPTDLRGSYFRQFWDVSEYRYLNQSPTATAEALAAREEELRDIKPIDTWGQNTLGINKSLTSPNPALLLAIRGDLLKRFPNTVVCAAKGIANTAGNVLPDLSNIVYPAHRTTLGEDIILFSFELTAAQVRGNFQASTPDYGYFFVLHERPGEPQFGLDASGPNSPLPKWDDLSWAAIAIAPGQNITQAKLTGVHVVSPPPAGSFSDIISSAHVAHAVFQKPFLVAIHAQSMMRPA